MIRDLHLRGGWWLQPRWPSCSSGLLVTDVNPIAPLWEPNWEPTPTDIDEHALTVKSPKPSLTCLFGTPTDVCGRTRST